MGAMLCGHRDRGHGRFHGNHRRHDAPGNTSRARYTRARMRSGDCGAANRINDLAAILQPVPHLDAPIP